MYFENMLKVLFFLTTLFILTTTSAYAQYWPPDHVTLTMYQLDASKGGASTGILCTRGDLNIAKSYGCTAITSSDVYSYPFTSSTITISIDGAAIVNSDNDGDLVEDNSYSASQRYLWDVAAQEIGLTGSNGVKPLAGIEAQAIASRTYTYQRILEGRAIDNSASLHVFLPYKFETLGQAEKNRLIEAMQQRYYMTPATDNPNTADNEAIYPILAQYGADNRERTTEGILEGKTIGALPNYLSTVEDPINALYGCSNVTIDDNGEVHIDYLANDHPKCGTGNGGMSSKGASRWSFGHTSSQGPITMDDTRYPSDANGLGDFWSVRWENALQILTHYYTGIHLRNANDSNRIVTPAKRWVPLKMTWPTADGVVPERVCSGSTLTLNVVVQNTGTETWSDNGSLYFWFHSPQGVQAAQPEQPSALVGLPRPTMPIEPGQTYTATIPYTVPQIGQEQAYDAYFEMVYRPTIAAQPVGFSQLEAGHPWPTYRVPLMITPCSPRAYLPLVQGGAFMTTSQ